MVEIRKLGTRGQTVTMMDPRIIKVMPSLNAGLSDPREMSAAETMKALIKFQAEARDIFAPALAAAE